MDVKFLEPLVRRAVQEKFPDSLHTTFEILKRAGPHGIAGVSINAIPGIGENLNDAIRQLIFDNFFSIKGVPMDPITELDIIQRLAEPLETVKKLDYLDLVFPAENPHVYELFCKIVSYALSMKCVHCLRKCTKYIKTLDVSHPLKVAVVNSLRADFCQISNLNMNDLLQLPSCARDLSVVFINTMFAQSSLPEVHLEFKVVAEWLSTDSELIVLIRSQISNVIRWYLTFLCRGTHDEQVIWKMHFAILEGVSQKASVIIQRGAKKTTYLTGENVKSWVGCLTAPCPTATDMLLQIMHVFLSTGLLSVTKDEMEWCMENIAKTEFAQLIMKTNGMKLTN